jgi:hypothetical protein
MMVFRVKLRLVVIEAPLLEDEDVRFEPCHVLRRTYHRQQPQCFFMRQQIRLFTAVVVEEIFRPISTTPSQQSIDCASFHFPTAHWFCTLGLYNSVNSNRFFIS